MPLQGTTFKPSLPAADWGYHEGTIYVGSAPLLRTQVAAYERSLIICVDQPWLQTPYALGMGQSLARQVDMLLVLYSTAFIRDWERPNAAEVAWEQEGLESSQPGSRVALADICPSFTSHLKMHFGPSAGQFALYTSSILVGPPLPC